MRSKSKSHTNSTQSERSVSRTNRRAVSNDSSTSRSSKNDSENEDDTNKHVDSKSNRNPTSNGTSDIVTNDTYRSGHRAQVAVDFNTRTTEIYARQAMKQRGLFQECEKALEKFHCHLENHTHVLADNAQMNAIERMDLVTSSTLTKIQ